MCKGAYFEPVALNIRRGLAGRYRDICQDAKPAHAEPEFAMIPVGGLPAPKTLGRES
jgi:hypothetical protein